MNVGSQILGDQKENCFYHLKAFSLSCVYGDSIIDWGDGNLFCEDPDELFTIMNHLSEEYTEGSLGVEENLISI